MEGLKLCNHKQQEVRKEGQHFVQRCLFCRIILAKWLYQSGKLVYGWPTEVDEVKAPNLLQ